VPVPFSQPQGAIWHRWRRSLVEAKQFVNSDLTITCAISLGYGAKMPKCQAGSHTPWAKHGPSSPALLSEPPCCGNLIPAKLEWQAA
jgi:hypothetical protein